jgi:hypothetical protein
MSYWDLADKLVSVVELLLQSHPCGLRVLTGEVPAPSFEDLVLMIQDQGKNPSEVRVQGGRFTSEQESCVVKAEAIQEALDACGGWEAVVGMAKSYREAFPQSWRIFVDHVSWVGAGGISRLSGEGQLERIAEKHGVSTDTVQRRRKEVVETIARNAMRVPSR